MTSQQKSTVRTLAEARNEAERFLWHLRPPWRGRFSHCHWWVKRPGAASREAAIWEVLRRHPNAERLCAPDSEPGSDFEWFMAKHGHKSWLGLTKAQRGEWRDALAVLPPQHGFDPRPLYSVTLQSVDLNSGANPRATLTLDENLRRRAKRNKQARRILQDAEQAQESEIARLAVEHHRAGRILIAVQPDISDLKDAADAFKRCLQTHRKSAGHGKAYVSEWLKVIRLFEKAELQRGKKLKRDDQLSYRYRKMIGSWNWPS